MGAALDPLHARGAAVKRKPLFFPKARKGSRRRREAEGFAAIREARDKPIVASEGGGGKAYRDKTVQKLLDDLFPDLKPSRRP
jgi:hypothetical protein